MHGLADFMNQKWLRKVDLNYATSQKGSIHILRTHHQKESGYIFRPVASIERSSFISLSV